MIRRQYRFRGDMTELYKYMIQNELNEAAEFYAAGRKDIAARKIKKVMMRKI